jgi:hypothetical protein
MTAIAMFAQKLRRARAIKKTLGIRRAAGYLRNQNVEFEQAHIALLGYPPRK